MYSRLSCSNIIDCNHSNIESTLILNVVMQETQHSWNCLTLSISNIGIVSSVGTGDSDGDIVAQDGYPLQSEGRTPGDEDSGGVDEDHSEVTDWLQQTCWEYMYLIIT